MGTEVRGHELQEPGVCHSGKLWYREEYQAYRTTELNNWRPSAESVVRAARNASRSAGALGRVPHKVGALGVDNSAHERVEGNKPKARVTSGPAIAPSHCVLDIVSVDDGTDTWRNVVGFSPRKESWKSP